MNFRDPPTAVFTLLAILYTVGLVGHAIPALLPWMLVLTPWFLAGSGALVFTVFAWKSDLKSLALWFIPVLLATYGLEVLGVATGAVFGPYHYTETLGTLFWGVPPVIGLNWVLVVLGVHTAVRSLVPRAFPLVRVLIVAVLCVAFDFLLEPVAIALGYWVWHTPEVPVQNYLAWGLIALAGAWWGERFSLPDRPLLGWYVVLQSAFFFILILLGVKA